MPGVPSAACRVRLRNPLDSTLSDASDGFFSLAVAGPTSEGEPNNAVSLANDLAIGDTVDASIDLVGDIDYYRFRGVAGDTVEVLGRERNSSLLSGMILVYDDRGTLIAQSLNACCPNTQTVPFIVPSSGICYFRYSCAGPYGQFPSRVSGHDTLEAEEKMQKTAGSTGDYAITLRRFVPPADVFPLEISNSWKGTFFYHWSAVQSFETDTGFVYYTIVGATHSQDSTTWRVFRQRSYTHTTASTSAPTPIVESRTDEGYFDIIESLDLRHRLHTTPYIEEDPFCLIDTSAYYTIPFYRYQTVDPEGEVDWNGSNVTNDRSISLRKGTGILTEYWGRYSWYVRYTLQSFSGQPLAIPRDIKIPDAYSLSQNYPNPFNPTTTIQYALPSRSYVTLTVFNTLGQIVRALVNGEMEAGYHVVQFDASGLSSGVYFYRMRVGDFLETKRLLLLR
jgi:hypothetical protein